MTLSQGEESDFERSSGAVLTESVQRIDARIRSRLNQARQAAVAAADPRARRERAWWNLNLMPAAGAVAGVALVALLLLQRPQPQSDPPLPGVETAHAAPEDLDLLADREGLELIEEWDGSFYEWAADQGETPAEAES